MKNRYLKLPILILLVCFGLTTILPSAALAGPKHGPIFRHVPPGSQKIRHRGDHYFFHRGRYYRHGPKGYFWVRPPIGIISYSLPAAALTVLIGGLTYYVYDNVYYRRVPAGYQVVQVPTQTTTVVHTPPAVSVNPAIPEPRSW